MFEKLFRVKKRTRCIFSSLLLAIGFFLIHFLDFNWRYPAIFLLTVLAYFLSAWSLEEGLQGVEWFSLLILPSLFTAGIGFLAFLVSTFWLARLFLAAFYGLGFYIFLLTENIFSVSAIRNIQLLRSAQATGFLLTLAVSLFLCNALLSFRLTALLNFFLIFLICFSLFLQGLWCVELEKKISRKVLIYATIGALLSAEFILIISFWPVGTAVASLGLVAVVYSVLGLLQHDLSGKLFRKTITEYLTVAAMVMAMIIVSILWQR